MTVFLSIKNLMVVGVTSWNWFPGWDTGFDARVRVRQRTEAAVFQFEDEVRIAERL
jgi:hypothetical protein